MSAPFDLSGWARRDEARREAANRLVAKVREARVPAAQVLRAHGVGEAYLFGSVARETNRPDSDVDLAVSGCPPEAFYRVSAEFERVFGAPLDLVDLDRAPADLAAAIRDAGIRIFP